MGVLDIFQKKRQLPVLARRSLDIPAAPPTFKDLPELPEVKNANSPELPDIEDIEEEVNEELEEREDLELKKPIFLKLDQFKDIMDEMGMIKNILNENDDALVRVFEFNEDQEKEYTNWENQIKDIQKKLIYADKTLFKARG